MLQSPWVHFLKLHVNGWCAFNCLIFLSATSVDKQRGEQGIIDMGRKNRKWLIVQSVSAKELGPSNEAIRPLMFRAEEWALHFPVRFWPLGLGGSTSFHGFKFTQNMPLRIKWTLLAQNPLDLQICSSWEVFWGAAFHGYSSHGSLPKISTVDHCSSQDRGMDLISTTMFLTIQQHRTELCFLLSLLVRYWTC